MQLHPFAWGGIFYDIPLLQEYNGNSFAHLFGRGYYIEIFPEEGGKIYGISFHNKKVRLLYSGIIYNKQNSLLILYKGNSFRISGVGSFKEALLF